MTKRHSRNIEEGGFAFGDIGLTRQLEHPTAGGVD
jgi:hypothetical protein